MRSITPARSDSGGSGASSGPYGPPVAGASVPPAVDAPVAGASGREPACPAGAAVVPGGLTCSTSWGRIRFQNHSSGSARMKSQLPCDRYSPATTVASCCMRCMPCSFRYCRNTRSKLKRSATPLTASTTAQAESTARKSRVGILGFIGTGRGRERVGEIIPPPAQSSQSNGSGHGWEDERAGRPVTRTRINKN